MANVNRVTLIGRITRDIELEYTPKGTAVTELGLAINRKRKDESGNTTEETTFIDVSMWGRQAELASQYLGKGREIYIEGRLQLDTWQDKQSGQNRSKLGVVCENMQFIGGNGGQGQQQAAPQRQAPPQQQQVDHSNIDENDDIPF